MLVLLWSIVRGETVMSGANLERLQSLGGVYIKFLQLVVLTLDVEGNTQLKALLGVYEHSAPDDIDIAVYLRCSLGQAASEITSIEGLPFATGSFGQVYRATYRGETVAIKVLRPSVLRYLRGDLRLLAIICRLSSWLYRQQAIDLWGIYREFRATCRRETDYLREAAATAHYATSKHNPPNLVIPKVYLEVSSDRVIAQEYLVGLSVAELIQAVPDNGDRLGYVRDHLGSDLHAQLVTVGANLLERAVSGELAQADPHPGNILLLTGDRVALIDFGMTSTLRDNQSAFLELMRQYQRVYHGEIVIEDFTLAALDVMAPKLGQSLRLADQVLVGYSRAGLVDRFRSAIGDFYAESQTGPVVNHFIQRRMMFKLLFYVVNEGNRFGLAFDMDAFILLKAAQQYLSLAGRIDPSGSVVSAAIDLSLARAEANPELVSLRARRVTRAEALETLTLWFDKMARNDPWLMQQLTSRYR